MKDFSITRKDNESFCNVLFDSLYENGQISEWEYSFHSGYDAIQIHDSSIVIPTRKKSVVLCVDNVSVFKEKCSTGETIFFFRYKNGNEDFAVL